VSELRGSPNHAPSARDALVERRDTVHRPLYVTDQRALELARLCERERHIDPRHILCPPEPAGDRKALAEVDAEGPLAFVLEHHVAASGEPDFGRRGRPDQAASRGLDGGRCGGELRICAERLGRSGARREPGLGRSRLSGGSRERKDDRERSSEDDG
jgi:hypothetical protein